MRQEEHQRERELFYQGASEPLRAARKQMRNEGKQHAPQKKGTDMTATENIKISQGPKERTDQRYERYERYKARKI